MCDKINYHIGQKSNISDVYYKTTCKSGSNQMMI